MKNNIFRIWVLIAFIIAQSTELLASPGGQIAKSVFRGKSGLISGIIVGILFFPFLIYFYIVRQKTVKSIKQQLATLSDIHFQYFDETSLKNRMIDVFWRVNHAWMNADLSSCEEFMTHWYLQNQQMVYLDKWKKENLTNVFSVKKIERIEPIELKLTKQPNFEGTRIMYSIKAEMEDYLMNKADNLIVEGDKGYFDVEKTWTLKLENGVWKLENIV